MIVSNYKAIGASIVIVGANSGIGIALTQQLLQAGATVFGIDIQDKSAYQSAHQLQYYKANPLMVEELKDALVSIKKGCNSIQGLVNLSGTISQFEHIEDLNFEAWEETYDISFKSCFNASKVFIPLLRNSAHAAIVNMSSGLAFIGQKNYGPYSAAKAAIVSFSKTLAAELAPKVRVNTVAPGAVDTNFIYKEDGSTRFNKERYTQMVPLGALAKPEEISSVILFLLSSGASHMTGQCLHINGGAGMH